MFLREAFIIYRSEVDEPVSFAKFCEFRPENVILLKNSANDQCKYLTHENLRLRLTGLKVTYVSQKNWTEVLCDATPNSVCWRQKCDECVNWQLLQLPVSIEPDSQVKWKEWENIEKMCSDESVRKVLVCSSKQSKAKELLGALKDNHEQTAVHINVKRIQAHDFEDDKKTAFVRILQVDFAMNYSCEYQNEVQSALWSRGAVMLFTAAVTYQDQCQTYLICSNSMDKGKNTTAVFLDTLYEKIFSDDFNSDQEIIWSDGPSSEFKNRFMVHLLHLTSSRSHLSGRTLLRRTAKVLSMEWEAEQSHLSGRLS